MSTQVEGNKLGERLGLGDAVLPDSLNDTLPTMRVLHMTFMLHGLRAFRVYRV